jgi:hypothetical protein
VEFSLLNRLIYEPHIWHIYQVLRWQSKHEVLHFCGSCVAGFLGTWAYAAWSDWRETKERQEERM